MRGWPKCTKIAWGQEKPNSKDKPAAPPPVVLWFLWRVCVCVCVCVCTHLVDQSCLTLCDPVNCSLPGFSVCGIFQARILEWVAMSFSRGIFPTQGSNLGLRRCRWILYQLSYQGSPLETTVAGKCCLGTFPLSHQAAHQRSELNCQGPWAVGCCDCL